jgi:Flp pilus assembly pilin Flp
MLALIVVVCIAAITTLGTNANATFTKAGAATNVANPEAPTGMQF